MPKMQSETERRTNETDHQDPRVICGRPDENGKGKVIMHSWHDCAGANGKDENDTTYQTKVVGHDPLRRKERGIQGYNPVLCQKVRNGAGDAQ